MSSNLDMCFNPASIDSVSRVGSELRILHSCGFRDTIYFQSDEKSKEMYGLFRRAMEEVHGVYINIQGEDDGKSS